MADPGENPTDPDPDPEGSDDPRERAVQHVLSTVFPDRRTASVQGTADTDEGLLVGVKADPQGYFSTAKYALVTVGDDGRVVASEAVTGAELREALDRDDD